ncbi:hypothetical protein NLJ89_g8756 [Agrocybe chaxingu]|uniref:SUZ domain-containing protein n=1 Tax=Agrocybe chaxingu TaxID=84603 RepID=A0A9W8MRV7_9AGAR|nr:hypothetical protein NLJ89_g8756 [Agrocybe chaxingu]
MLRLDKGHRRVVTAMLMSSSLHLFCFWIKPDNMSRSVDAWGDEPMPNSGPIASNSGSSSESRPKKPTKSVVRDDWEDDEEEEDVGRSVDAQNKKLWEDANSREYRPMPAVIMYGGSSTSSAAPTLPLNQPPAMKILKRPSPSVSPSQSSSNVNAASTETFQDREARYQAARERIFGPSSDISPNEGSEKKKISPSQKSTPPTSLPPANKVVREPRGPNSVGINPENKGFSERKARPPPNFSAISPTSPSSDPPARQLGM